MRRQLIGDDAVFDVLLIGQAEMFFRRHIAQHGRAVPADLRRANRRGDVVITRRNIGGQRPQRVEGGLVAPV